MKLLLPLFIILAGIPALMKAQSCQITLSSNGGATITGYASLNNGTTGNFSFDMGDGNTISNGNQFSYTYSANGTYTVCAYYRDSLNNIICSSCDTVIIGGSTPTCSTSFTSYPDTSVFAGVYFSNNSSGAAPFTYAYTYGDNTSGTMDTHTYPDTTSYYACVTMTDANGCQAQYCDYINWNQNGQNSCQVVPVLYDNGNGSVSGYAYGGSSTSSFTWTFSDGTSATGSQISHQYTQNGTYSICVTAYDSFLGCTSSACDSITITGVANGACYNSFTSTVSGNTAAFTPSVFGGSGSYTISWSYGDNNVGTSSTHTYAATGTYYVCLETTDANGCVYTSCDSVYVGTTQPAMCNAYFEMYPDSANGTPNGVWYGYDLSNNGGANPANTSYTWDFGDGTVSNQLYPTHTYASPGTYVVCLTVVTTSGFGTTCTSTYCDSSSVQRIASGTVMNSITIIPAATAIKNVDKSKSILVSPNPSNGSVYLNISGAVNSSLKVYDMLGNVISFNKSANSNYQLNISELGAGTYILMVSDNVSVTTKKFVVTK